MKQKISFRKATCRAWPVKICFIDPHSPAAIHPQKFRKFKRAASCHANTVHFSSVTDDWSTPQWLFDSLNNEFDFTLDPCASATNAKCDSFFTREQNGLLQNWGRHIVFMNPPYGREIGRWMQKACDASNAGATVIALIPARPDTNWWHQFVVGIASEIRFLKGRIKFGQGENSAPFPSVVIIYRGAKEIK